MTPSHAQPFTAGRFLLTPFSRDNLQGGYNAALSVRRGLGRQTHDQVYTLKPAFLNPESAMFYAAVQGRYWLLNPHAFA